MKVKELIERLKECEQNSLIQFYFLKDYDLNNCKLETILQADGQTEITIEAENNDGEV
jgi:hypothetical protein